MSFIPIIAVAAAAGTFFVVRRSSAADKKKKRKKGPGAAPPPEPAAGGAFASWAYAYFTIVVQTADSPSDAPFTWGVFDTEGLRQVSGSAVVTEQGLMEAKEVGYLLGAGRADTYADAVNEAQLWADTIRDPLDFGETLATVIEGTLIIVTPKDAHLERPVRWLVYAYPAKDWPNWSLGELPTFNQAAWQFEAMGQDAALGQGVLYALLHAVFPEIDGDGVSVGSYAANTEQRIVWSGTPGLSSLVAVGRKGGRTAGSNVAGLAVGATRARGRWRPRLRARTRIIRRTRHRRVAPGGRKPIAPRWIGEVAMWSHAGRMIVLERVDPRTFQWSIYDLAGLASVGFDLTRARGFRRSSGFARTYRIAVRDAEAAAKRSGQPSSRRSVR